MGLAPLAFATALEIGCYGRIGEVGAPSTGTGPGNEPAPEAPREIAASPLLRLTRAQYDNIARDLLRANFVPSSALSTDERVGPFAVNAEARMTRGLAEQYQFVAEKLGLEVADAVQSHAPCADMAGDGARCAEQFIARFGRLAFRRPLADDERARWRAVYDAAAAGQSYAAGIRAVVEAMLQSPSFIYRLELLPQGQAGETYPLDAFALASRLAFLLWNSAPDDALLDAAAQGELAKPAGLSAQIDRMLASARARRAIAAFVVGWVGLDGLDATATTERLEGLAPALVPLMREEAVDFVDEVLRRGDGQLATLFTAGYTFADARLASAVYGPSAVPDASGRIALDPRQRAGVLTQAGVLFAHAHVGQSSPVLRGKWVREALLCQQVPDPPPDVNATPPEPTAGQTTRERYAAHRANPACSSCHGLLDDVGFGFEHYDALGRFRSTESGKPVDSAGTLRGTDVDGDFADAPALGRRLAQSEVAARCFARQWVRFGLGRTEGAGEGYLVDAMSAALREGGGGHRALVRALVESESFTHRRSP